MDSVLTQKSKDEMSEESERRSIPDGFPELPVIPSERYFDEA